MQLAAWLKSNAKTPADLAAALGVERSTVARYVSGERRPRAELARRIAELTGGQVTANDFVDVVERPVRSVA